MACFSLNLTRCSASSDTAQKWFEPGASFVAGSLIHTKNGLIPIEQIKVGDWVLSQPEAKGELSYKRVTRTFEHKSNELYLMRVSTQGRMLTTQADSWFGQDLQWIVVTGNHPFYVKDKGWVKARNLYGGADPVELLDGSYVVPSLFPIFKTLTPDICWAPYGNDEDPYHIIDFTENRVVVRKNKELLPMRAPPGSAQYDWPYRLKIRREGFHKGYYHEECRTVYNFEVEDNHTYYVGELGIWVHDKPVSRFF